MPRSCYYSRWTHLFQANGWKATVLERSTEARRSGGGVVVQRRMADYIESHGMASPGITSIPVRSRILYQPDGSTLRLPETARSYAARDVLLQEFEKLVGESSIVRGSLVVDIHQDKNRGSVVLRRLCPLARHSR